MTASAAPGEGSRAVWQLGNRWTAVLPYSLIALLPSMSVFEPLLGFRFERAGVGDGRRRSGLGEELFEPGDAVGERLDGAVDVFALRFEGDDASFVFFERRLRLRAMVDLVEIEQFLDV